MRLLGVHTEPARRPLGKLGSHPRPRLPALGPCAVLATLVLLGGLAAAADRVEPPSGHVGPSPPLPIPAAGGEKGPALVLVWFDPQRLLPSALPALMGEVGATFREIGVEVAWRRAGPGTACGEGPAPEVPVILLRADPRRDHEDEHVMGLVIADQQPRRAVWVFLSAVRRTLGQTSLDRPLTAREAPEVARALAGVVAHEVVHAIAPEKPHARAGLMNHSLSRAFLLGTRSRLDEAWGRTVRSHLLAGPSLGGGPPAQAVRDLPGPVALTPREEPP